MQRINAIEILRTRINKSYWYDDKVNLEVLNAMLRNFELKLANQNRGIVLNADRTLFKRKNYTFNVGYDLVLSQNAELMTSKLDLIAKEISNILSWNKQQLESKDDEQLIKIHKFLLPLNINNLHWIALVLELEVLQQDQDFILHPVVVFSLIDSLPGFSASRLARIQEMLRPYLEKFMKPGQKILSIDSKIATKRQSDSSSCGPLTVKAICDIISDVVFIAADKSYTEQEIIDLRLTHILAVNDEKFTKKQEQFIEARLPDKRLNGNAMEQAEHIYEYLLQLAAEQRSEFNLTIQQFIETDDALQNVNLAPTDMTVQQFEDLDRLYKERLSLVKKWFQTHYISLDEMKLIHNIFKARADRLVDLELEWVDGGKDTLVAILKIIVKLPDHYAQKKRQQELPPTVSSPTKEITAKVLIDQKGTNFMFQGPINTAGQPHGHWNESVGPYSYRGEYINGVKSGFGKEEYFDPDLKMSIYYEGTRGNYGALDKGWMRCIIGPGVYDDCFLLCQGFVYEGSFIQRCQLILIHYIKQEIFSVAARARDGVIKILEPQQLSNKDASLVAAIERHLAEYQHEYHFSMDTPGGKIEELRCEVIARAAVKAAQADSELETDAYYYGNKPRLIY